MTWTLAPDDPKREFYRSRGARRSNRESLGNVYYPPEWRNLSRPASVASPGDAPYRAARAAAQDPAAPLHPAVRWMLSNEYWLSIVLGCIGGGLVSFVGWRIAQAVAEFWR